MLHFANPLLVGSFLLSLVFLVAGCEWQVLNIGKKKNKDFDPGESLLGVITDWSDAEISGLSEAVGNDVAKKLLKGCSVHWSRSWQRVRDRVAKSNDQQRERMLFGIVIPTYFYIL